VTSIRVCGASTLANSLFPTAAIAMEIAEDERSHVTLIQQALTAAGAQPVAQPAINLDALGIGFGSLGEFLTLARAFEDVGVTAYAGGAPLISDKGILGYAARILAEAEHVANIRLQVAQLGVSTTLLDGLIPKGKEIFDPLGPRWPTHECYRYRDFLAIVGPSNKSIRLNSSEQYVNGRRERSGHRQ
jgi:hypothetical protein